MILKLQELFLGLVLKHEAPKLKAPKLKTLVESPSLSGIMLTLQHR